VRVLLVALLLVLAASPLTAPFSVHTPIDTLGDFTSWSSPKKLADDLKTDGVPARGLSLPGGDGSRPGRPVTASPAGVQQQDRFPLRI
jgi:hypothetical protein